MIRVVEGLPDNVVGIVATGRVTNEDCNNVLRPLIETSLKRHDKLRLYYEIDCRFPGAAWKNLRLELENVPHWGADGRRDRCQLAMRHDQRFAVSDTS